MRAESTKCRVSDLGILLDRDAPAVFADSMERHVSLDEREQSVVAADADPRPGRDLRAALADDDRSGVDELAPIGLDAEHLRVRVAAVAGRAAALLVRHSVSVLLRAAARSLLRGFRRGLVGGRLRDLRRRGLAARLRLRRGGSLSCRGARWPRCLGAAAGLRRLAHALLFLLFFGLLVDVEADAADRDDLERGQVGAPALVDAHALLRLVPDRLDARTAAVIDHACVNVDTVDPGLADLDVRAIVEKQDPPED